MVNQFRKFVLLTVFTISLLGLGRVTYAQDLSQTRVDELSDAQVKQFLKQVQSTGLSEDQLEAMASARGMSSTEVTKLRDRANKLKGSSIGSASVASGDKGSEVKLQDSNVAIQQDPSVALLSALEPRIFGHDLFRNANPQFVPSLRIATPQSYVIGSGDQLLIDIYGDSEVSYSLTVSPEGRVNIPYVGVVSVAGTNIAQLSSRLQQQLSSVYSGLNSGRTKLNISLGEMRSIQVTLAGEVFQAGNYTLPSVSTIFNALHAAGGPTAKGSVRNVKVLRNGIQVAELDVYDFLINGSLVNNITLQDQDVVQVSIANTRVNISGEVKRAMYFDMKVGETFADALCYAGGFTDKAYASRVSVERLTQRERRLEDVLASQFSNYTVQSGDRFNVGSILDRFENRVRIEGAVFNPDAYELTTGLTLSMLIKKADGVKEDAFMGMGYINRRKDNLELERINFNVAAVLAGTAEDIVLKKEDVVHIASIRDLKNEYTVRIEGEVRRPGTYNFAEGTTIQSLILQAGGFKETASASRIEVSRRILDTNPLDQRAKTAETFHVDIDKDLNLNGATIALEPFDFITIRSRAGYESQRNVRIEGEVVYPGIYTITAKDERISDLVKRAGGVTVFAYPEGASLKRGGIKARAEVKSSASESQSEQFEDRMVLAEERERVAEVEELVAEGGLQQSDKLIEQSRQNDYVGVSLKNILQNEDSRDNIFLEEGDVLYIPKQLQTVRINGEVLSPVNTVYREGMSFKDYVSQAGGFSAEAQRKKSYVIYANGSARSTKSFLGIKTYPKVEPGAELFVPQKPQREKMSPQAWIGMGTGVASLAAIIVSLLRK